MPVDTSIYGDLLKQPSPIENAQAFAGINNSLQQNALLQNQTAVANQTFKANRAMGPIMQSSVDPQTGQVDWNKAITLASQNPDTAFIAGDLMTKAYQGQGLQLKNKLDELAILGKQNEIFGNTALGAVAQHGDAVTSDDVAKMLTNMHSTMVSQGLDPDGKLADGIISFMAQLPAQNGPKLSEYLKGIGVSHGASAQAINSVTGSFETKDTGPSLQIFHINPYNNQYAPVGVIDKGPTPGEANAPVTTTDATGAQHVGTARQTLPLTTGLGAPINPPAQGGAPGGPAVNASPVTKLGPYAQGQQENMVGYSKDLNNSVSGIQTQLQMVQQLQDLSKQFKPGAGSAVSGKLAGLAQAVGMPQTTVDAIGRGDYSALQAFEKYGVQNTMNVLRQAIGGQGRLTNLEFEQFLHSNPNIDTDPRAIDKILSMAQRMYQIKIAEQKGLNDWTKTGHDPAAFPEAWTQKLMQRGILRGAQQGDLSNAGAGGGQ